MHTTQPHFARTLGLSRRPPGRRLRIRMSGHSASILSRHILYSIMPRKPNIIRDELGHLKAGLYCFTPYSQLDDTGKIILKVGMAAGSFYDRLESYHTYFPRGVYVVSILEAPPVRSVTTRKQPAKTKYEVYRLIESHIFAWLHAAGATMVKSTTRVSDRQEWWYTTPEVIHEVFTKARVKFGGELTNYNLDNINEAYAKEVKANPKAYVGEIVFPV